MAGPKAKIPAPIDRPLSRAYLREFTGWSTAYPPGLSDPTSLRIMENVMVNRDGSLRVRPGLRYLSYATPPDAEGGEAGVAFDKQLVGTHEVFFLNDGSKAYLFAVREDDDTVGFRVLRFTDDATVVHGLTDAGIDFVIPQGEAAINFSAETTYVKYLQVDNKIFALSDAGETMRLFYVGVNKSVRKILSIERPNWDVADKLTVMHPEAAWITGASAEVIRRNGLHNPAMVGTFGWTAGPTSGIGSATTPVKNGDSSLKVTSDPQRTNLQEEPLDDVATYGIGTWDGGDFGTLSVSGSYLKLDYGTGTAGRHVYAHWGGGLINGIVAGQKYRVAVDFGSLHDSVDGSILVRFYNSSNVQVGPDMSQDTSVESARKVFDAVTAPTGATKMRVRVGMEIKTTSAHSVEFRNLLVCKDGEPTDMFSGDTGANYFWKGAANASQSVYHPPADAWATSNKMPVEPGESVVAAIEQRLEAAAGNGWVGVVFYDSTGAIISTSWSLPTGLSLVAWTRLSEIAVAPALATHAALEAYVDDLPRNVDFYLDEGLLESAAAVDTYFDGDNAPTTTLVYQWDGTNDQSTSSLREYDSALGIPTPETPTADTLVAIPGSEDDFELGVFYNFAFFYTFSNEIGESAASQITTIKTQRGWSAWRWETGNAAGEPSGTPVADPSRAADQLVAVLPEDVFDSALAQEAQRWNLYMLTWSNQTSVPVVGVKVVVTDLTNNPTYDSHGWAQVTPQSQNIDEEAPVPHISRRRNYSDPSRGGQGIVAADRMVLVHDPVEAAVIRWTGNEQGDYINFTAARGGGYKTLTSGNLMVPAAVKLWQNPESKDTLTILCRGADGHSTSYYMQPAVITSQSDATAIMGFEETTATQGTTSPYGCEVLNNALYHPLDDQLTKSTATNYNINHKSMTDQIEDRWQSLEQKEKIVSSVHDNRIYYIVHNPKGDLLEEGMNGNEIWVFDASAENGHWSRWKIQAHSLRKIEQGGRIHMSVIRPDGIFYLDPAYDRDDIVDPSLEVTWQYIPWAIETNTQGANRAHDAWAHLRQAQISLGNFQGRCRWGVRGWDVHGKAIDISKVTSDLEPTDTERFLPFDIDDQLRIAKDMQQWFFYAESILEDDEVTVVKGVGQINNVQYRYAPVSVNVGYEYGSVETFEYGRDLALATSTSDDGVPTPFNDRRRP